MLNQVITGYCSPLSLRGGEHIELFAASHVPGQAALELVRLHCGDPTRHGPGFAEEPVPAALPASVTLDEQPLAPGSFGEIPLAGARVATELTIDVHVMPTRTQATQTVLAIEATSGVEYALRLRDGCFVFDDGIGVHTLAPQTLAPGGWHHVVITVCFESHAPSRARVNVLPSRSPGRDLLHGGEARSEFVCRATVPGALRMLRLAASAAGECFDGRIARLRVCADAHELAWDFAVDMGGRRLAANTPGAHDGVLHQLPARGVTGPGWDGRFQAWRERPDHYDAVHFHSDDLYDAGWRSSAALTLPPDLPSGVYAFRLTLGEHVHRVPFFVRPAVGARTADVALLFSTCTYMAYANHRMLFEGADFVAARSRLRPAHAYVRDHPELGPSMYEKHVDGSGVMFSSRLRPNLQLQPGADGWNFTPDTDIHAFLRHLDCGHDVLADEDLHTDGVAALRPYRVLVTGTHPEYWSTRMLDALEQWQREGGRLLYLGGNGFYWRVAFSEAWPGAIELRRAEDGVRNWQCEPGESYHAFTGEYGGLWRRLGRAPNALVGVGFAAQGFERSVGYERLAASYDSRAAWIFDGVDDAMIGTSGLGGGAAGQEVDRYNPALGSPAHALVLASATAFGPDMTRTKEELDASIVVPTPDPVVRADMVYFETAGGGAVFSVGSIAWFGALARNGYVNDVARITANVVRRFLDPAPLPKP